MPASRRRVAAASWTGASGTTGTLQNYLDRVRIGGNAKAPATVAGALTALRALRPGQPCNLTVRATDPVSTLDASSHEAKLRLRLGPPHRAKSASSRLTASYLSRRIPYQPPDRGAALHQRED